MIAAASRLRRLARKALRRSLPGFPWRMRPVILMYHCVDDDSFDPWGLSVSPENFEAQVGWLAANRTVLPLADFAELQGDGSLPPDAVAITFDDGCASFADTAAPILERAHVPATLFLPAGLIGQRDEFWWDRLARLILGFDGDRLSVLGKTSDLGPPQPDERKWRPNQRPSTSRQRLFLDSWARIRTRPIDEIDRMLDDIEDRSHGFAPVPAKLLMTAEQARSVSSAIVEVGSHALTHPSLPAIDSAEKRREICGSIERCEALTGRSPRTFAYPFGDYDEESRALVEECGFACACTTERRPVGPRDRPSKLPRVGMGNWDIELTSRVLTEI